MTKLVHTWFEKWEEGDFQGIPVTDGFRHTSPFGTVESKRAYLELVESNQEPFLGYRFEIHDEMYEAGRACVRYTAKSGDYELVATEWFFGDDDGIAEIISFYNVGEVPEYENPTS